MIPLRPINQKDLNEAVQRFTNLRGDLFTEGIMLNEFVDLKKYAANTNEWHAFYLHGKLLSLCKNSHQPNNAPGPPKDLVKICTGLESPYYTIDFAEWQAVIGLSLKQEMGKFLDWLWLKIQWRITKN